MKFSKKTWPPIRPVVLWSQRSGLLRSPLALFIIIAFVFGMVFVIKTPPLWGADETTHYARAYEIAQGQWTTKRLPYPWGGASYGDYIPTSLYNLIWHVNGDITVDNNVTSYGVKRIDNIKSYSSFTGQKLNSSTTKAYFYPNSAVYSPVAYIPSALAIKISMVLNLSVGQSIFLGRLFGLLFYIACIAFVIKALKKSGFAWLVLAVALIPMNLFEASTINSDITANALSILVVGLVVKGLLSKKLTTAELVCASAAALLLPVVKPPYVFLSFAIFLLPSKAINLPRRMPVSSYKVILVVVALILLAIWTYFTREVAAAFRLIGTGNRWGLISITGQTHFLIHHPWSFITVLARTMTLQDNTFFDGLFGSLSFDYVQVPAVSIVATFTAILISMGISDKFLLDKKRLLFAAALLIGGVLALFGSFYLTFSNVADPIVRGVQGRYFLPFALLGLTIVCLLFPSVRLRATQAEVSKLGMGIACLSLLSLIFASIKFFYVLLG